MPRGAKAVAARRLGRDRLAPMNALLSRVLRRGDDGALTAAPDLRSAFARPGPWLAIAPHDDDIVLGMGLVVAAAAAEGVEIHLAVTSDGGLGYLRPEDRPK